MSAVLESERLALRPFVDTDADAVQAYAGHAGNVDYMQWGPNTIEQTRSFLSDVIWKGRADPRTNYDFAVTLRFSGHLIGACGIYLDAELTQGHLGWILHRDYWHNGYGTEMGGALLRFGFDELKLHRIWATCNAENYGSFRVMERNGMRREAQLVESRYGKVHGQPRWYDEYEYAILANEWRTGITL